MNDYEPSKNYSLLNEEKKNKIMRQLREEINKQKEEYSMNSQNFNEVKNNNYDFQNSNNSNFRNMNDSQKNKYNLNDNMINDNELEERDSNVYKESEDNNEEEHYLILNNAKNVLNQIQDDINKFSELYGINNINGNNKIASNPNNNNNQCNYKNNLCDRSNHKILIDNNECEENSSNADYKNVENNDENYEEEDNNIHYSNNDDNNGNDIGNDNEEEDNSINYNLNNNNKEESYEDEINNNYNNNNIQNYNNNFNDNEEYNSEKQNDIYEPTDDIIEYNKFDSEEEESPKKIENFNYINKFAPNSNNISMPIENSSKSKYHFENPLNYNKEIMNFNYNKYSTNINKEERSYQLNNENNRKAKSITKKKNNNINNNMELIDKPKKQINKSNNYSHNISQDKSYISKSKEKFETMKIELENKFAEEHPFKPKINKNYNKKKEETDEERFNRLSRPKILDINEMKRKKELEESKREIEKKESKNTHKINPKEVCNRLYNLHQEMKMKKDKIKQNLEENQNKEYSFTPEINPYSKLLMDKYEKKSIYERNEEFKKQKDENIIRMRIELEKDQKERSKPLINEKSRKLALMNRNNNKNDNEEQYDDDVYERLYRDNINKDVKSLANREMKECTFAPKLNPISEYLINNNYSNEFNLENINDNNMKDFLERQKMYEEIKKEKLEKNKINNKTQYTFKPEINSNSDLLVKCNPERYAIKDNDKYIRLYQEAEKIKIKKEKLGNELNNKYNFIPKINELSKYIGRKPDINKLNYQENNFNKENKMAKKEEEYDFKPQLINNNYKNIKSNYKNDQNMLNRINEEVNNKNKKIKMMQMLQENKDIEQCNFTPEINKEIPNYENNKPIYMKGMARYLNQMEKARKAKRDKEQREKEVFFTGENWNKNNGITVPKPFKLSYQNNQKKEKNEMMKDKKEKEDKKEGNKLKTNESKNRDIIKKLLITN